MIIRNEGLVVGMLDENSLVLESESKELISLVEEWRKNGIEELFAAPDSEQVDGEDSDGMQVIEFTSRNIHIFENELIKEGFEVQTE